MRRPRLPAHLLLFLALALRLGAQVVIYTDRTSLLADPRVGAAATVDFDSFAPGTDLTNQTFNGVTLEPNTTGPLLVITGSSGVRYPLSPSSGANVLSPGGNDGSLENDGLIITFATPVQFAGLDIVFDVPDGASFVDISFFDSTGGLLGSYSSIPAPSGAPGYQFMGMVSDYPNIARIVISEYDPTAMDDNVAYDSLTYSLQAIPEPSTYLLLASGLAVIGAARRRHDRQG